MPDCCDRQANRISLNTRTSKFGETSFKRSALQFPEDRSYFAKDQHKTNFSDTRRTRPGPSCREGHLLTHTCGLQPQANVHRVTSHLPPPSPARRADKTLHEITLSPVKRRRACPPSRTRTRRRARQPSVTLADQDEDADVDRGFYAMAPPELYGAAFYGDAERVRTLLKEGADPGARDEDGDTPLHAAALHGYALCELYLAYTRSPRDGYDQDYEEDEDEDEDEGEDGVDGEGRAPLPPPGAYFEVVKELLAAGADPCAANRDGVTPLHMAALWDHAAEMQALLAAGADARAPDADGRTPLHLAAEGDAHRAVSLLLAAGADPQARDHAGRTALDLSEDAPLRQMLAPKRPWAGIAAIALPISILALYTFLIL